MNAAIPKSLENQVRRRARWRGITEIEYIRVALKQAVVDEGDETIAEMRLLDEASLEDFQQFAKEYRL